MKIPSRISFSTSGFQNISWFGIVCPFSASITSLQLGKLSNPILLITLREFIAGP